MMTAQTSSGTAKVTLPTDEQILITRDFNAPKHLVYQAYTTPALVKRWWGGGCFTVTVAEIDLRVGGRWRYVLVDDGGAEVAFHAGRTTLTLLVQTTSKELRDAIIHSGMETGMQRAYDALEQIAASLA